MRDEPAPLRDDGGTEAFKASTTGRKLMRKDQSSVENFASVREAGVEAQVRLPLDREEIADVARRYAQNIDARDFDML